MADPLRVAYLLEDTALSDDAWIALAQADALVARGHRVRLVTTGLPLTWRSSRAEWVYVDDLGAYDASTDEFVVAPGLMQMPNLIVVDDEFYRTRTPAENDPMRVLLCGQSQDDVKGIAEGYGAAGHARWFHQKFDLVRASPWAPSREEPLDDVQEFHVALDTREMTRLMHSCDILIAPSHRDERFSLPVAQAMASGVPTVLTLTPSHLAFDGSRDFALFAPEENPVELGERLIELLTDFEVRDRLRKRGRELAEQWRAERAGARLEEFFVARRDTSTVR